MRYDVIVVGAGPAGSTTARECATRGLRTLLLDKAEFPRDKPCGGGVTIRTHRLMPFDISPVIERTVYGITLSVRRSESSTFHSPKPLTYLTQRSRLDTLLVQQAVEAGATLRERAPIKDLQRHGSHVTVTADGQSFEGRALVAADGANGRTAKLAGISVPRRAFVGLEGNITPDGSFPREWEEAIGLDIGAIPGGYGWVFPKGDHLNVGIAGWQQLGPSLRRRLDKVTRYYRFHPEKMWGVRGHHLPTRRPEAPLVDENVVLVGDAAGLLDPFTGEGIYAAVWSGRTAAAHLEAYVDGRNTDLSGYEQDVQRELISDLRAATQLYDLYHCVTPTGLMRIIQRSPRVWGQICNILRGDQTYTGVTQRFSWLSVVVNLASYLVRTNPRLGRLAYIQDPPAPEAALPQASDIVGALMDRRQPAA